MLMGSALPYYGQKRETVIKKILANRYSFKASRWKRISPEAKDFIRTLLVSDPEQRADAEEALGSVWLQQQVGPRGALQEREEEMARSSMLRYAGYPKLKKMVSNKNLSDDMKTFDDGSQQWCFRRSWWWRTDPAAVKSASYVNSLNNMMRDMMGRYGLKIFATK